MVVQGYLWPEKPTDTARQTDRKAETATAPTTARVQLALRTTESDLTI